MGLTGFRIDHLLRVPVVGCDHGNASRLANCFGDPTQTDIHVLACFNRLI